METISTFAPITKTTDQDDGSLLVYGKASDGSLDLDDQRCDPAWLDQAMPAWFGSGGTGIGGGVGGNIRAQHRSDSAVGKAIEHENAPDGHYITAKIVDRDAIAKTKAGVFTGFSIGIRRPRIVKSDDAPNGKIVSGTITEISLVDRPANSNCVLTLCKAAKPGMSVKSADFDSKHLLVRCEELIELDKAAPEIVVKLDTPLAQDTVDKVDAVFGQVDKATDTGHLDAPAPGQICDDCGEDGHLNCGPADVGFNREAAKTLVTETLQKAGDGLGQDESGDISGADAAIATIAKLIISEAQDLADMPSQACDIHLLMSAVDALRCFARREQAEQSGVDPDAMYLAADVDRGKSKYDADDMAKMLKNGQAMRNAKGDPSYPIADREDLSHAIRAVGRGSGDHDAIRTHILARAKALGASELIPDNWTSGKSAGVEVTVQIDDKVLDKAVEDAVEKMRTEIDPPEVDGEVDEAKTAESDAEKTTESETTKAVAVDADTATGNDDLVKAFSATMEKLEKTMANVEAATETTAKSVNELTERLVKVEAMAAPGGPALRRTDAEVKKSRQGDLLVMAEVEESKARGTHDNDLRQGYLSKALELRSEARALAS